MSERSSKGINEQLTEFFGGKTNLYLLENFIKPSWY